MSLPSLIVRPRFHSLLPGLLASLLTSSCQCTSSPAKGSTGTAVSAKPFVPTARCPVAQPALTVVEHQTAEEAVAADEMQLNGLEDAFHRAYDDKRDEEALACALEISRIAPEEAVGHLYRASALEGLGLIGEALSAYDRALALDPNNPEVLLAAAEFLVQSGDTDSLETAILYSRRGRENEQNLERAARLAATEASALNSVGRSEDALNVAESALTLNADEPVALLQRGIALFELARFEESDKAMADARAHDPQSGKVFYYSGLLAERLNRAADARTYFKEASRLDPEAYPGDLDVTTAEFQNIVDEQVAGLPEEQQASLKGTHFSWTDLPATEDLLAGDPVLSPTIVGIYRPGSPGQSDAILLYRKNLLHVVRSRQELQNEVRDTLLHELGHLAGEDDDQLRNRGL